jgi:hypothetical protein
MLEKLRRLRFREWPVWLQELLVFVTFLAITALMTWPWVTRMRDAVADNGDSYAFVWSLWWNYHQTFSDPLNLFHANIFYPYRYTLAFTEHGYGVALLFFPLLVAGLRPITVYSVATFFAFAFSGYGAFRLARTLTSSNSTAWVAGIVFAFVPYHFMFLTALPYLFTGWIPLLLEALVLFVRLRSWRRAAWLGVAFLMNGLTCINWFLLMLGPFVLSAALLIVRHRLLREREFWMRGLLALAAASLLLMPFMRPYYMANKLYGFRRDAEEVARNSAGLVDWLATPAYNKVWNGMGNGIAEVKATLFPGLLPLLLALAALLLITRTASRASQPKSDDAGNDTRRTWLYILDSLCIVAGIVAIIVAGLRGSPGRLVTAATADRVLLVLTIAFVVRLCISYPQFLKRTEGRNLIESLRSDARSDAFWLGVTWAGFGFLCSFGMSIYLYRVLYDFVLPLQSLRAPSRAAMICYVGLAVLATLGAGQLAQLVANRRPAIKPWATYSVIVAALLFELHAAPMPFIRGAVFPDAVTLQLKKTSMRGGVVELPSLPQPPYYSWHLSMLRSADHGHPVVFAASSFTPPLTMKVHDMTKGPGIPKAFLDLLEEIPASYVVVRRSLVEPERQAEFSAFLGDAVASGRLRFIGSYDGSDDLYAVMKTEPRAQADAK